VQVPEVELGVHDGFVRPQLLEVHVEEVESDADVGAPGELDDPPVVGGGIHELAHLEMVGGLEYQANAAARRVIAHAPQGIDRHERRLGHVVAGDGVARYSGG
jgi:hypothetical protein